MIAPKKYYAVKALWWFWAPLALAALTAIANTLLGKDARNILYTENGVLETLQAFIAFSGTAVAALCLRHCKDRPWLIAWCGLAMLACLYIGLEEISYGQHLFGWQTPEDWSAINDQNETNLHNTSSWLDQKPRLILYIGGILIPGVRRYKPTLLPSRFSIVYPQNTLFCTAAIAIFADIAKKLHKADILTLYDRASEVHEAALFYFVLLYLLMLRPRLAATEDYAH